ncbi:MAG TPA: phage head closure protein [Allosphingosinicella sp.]|jgi:SPP1 family predicted phage head-tail adaptor
MSIAAGELNRMIAIEQRGAVLDEANQSIDAWTAVPGLGALWARPLTANGMSSVRAAQEGIPVSPGRYSWRIRYRPVGITTDMRVNHKGMFFDIRDIRHDIEHHDWTDLVCELGGNDG